MDLTNAPAFQPSISRGRANTLLLILHRSDLCINNVRLCLLDWKASLDSPSDQIDAPQVPEH